MIRKRALRRYIDGRIRKILHVDSFLNIPEIRKARDLASDIAKQIIIAAKKSLNKGIGDDEYDGMVHNANRFSLFSKFLERGLKELRRNSEMFGHDHSPVKEIIRLGVRQLGKVDPEYAGKARMLRGIIIKSVS